MLWLFGGDSNGRTLFTHAATPLIHLDTTLVKYSELSVYVICRYMVYDECFFALYEANRCISGIINQYNADTCSDPITHVHDVIKIYQLLESMSLLIISSYVIRSQRSMLHTNKNKSQRFWIHFTGCNVLMFFCGIILVCTDFIRICRAPGIST